MNCIASGLSTGEVDNLVENPGIVLSKTKFYPNLDIFLATCKGSIQFNLIKQVHFHCKVFTLLFQIIVFTDSIGPTLSFMSCLLIKIEQSLQVVHLEDSTRVRYVEIHALCKIAIEYCWFDCCVVLPSPFLIQMYLLV